MVRTTDGGGSWRSMTQPPGDVTGIRFATDQIGYAYSADVLEMTTDGGASWQPQDGGAIALESLDGNVIRVTSTAAAAPVPVPLGVEYAPVGGSTWTRAEPAGRADGAVSAVQLVRSESDAYVLVTGHPAGGAPKQQSTLLASERRRSDLDRPRRAVPAAGRRAGQPARCRRRRARSPCCA